MSSKQVFAVVNQNSALADVCSAIAQLLAGTLYSKGFPYLSECRIMSLCHVPFGWISEKQLTRLNFYFRGCIYSFSDKVEPPHLLIQSTGLAGCLDALAGMHTVPKA